MTPFPWDTDALHFLDICCIFCITNKAHVCRCARSAAPLQAAHAFLDGPVSVSECFFYFWQEYVLLGGIKLTSLMSVVLGRVGPTAADTSWSVQLVPRVTDNSFNVWECCREHILYKVRGNLSLCIKCFPATFFFFFTSFHTWKKGCSIIKGRICPFLIELSTSWLLIKEEVKGYKRMFF